MYVCIYIYDVIYIYGSRHLRDISLYIIIYIHIDRIHAQNTDFIYSYIIPFHFFRKGFGQDTRPRDLKSKVKLAKPSKLTVFSASSAAYYAKLSRWQFSRHVHQLVVFTVFTATVFHRVYPFSQFHGFHAFHGFHGFTVFMVFSIFTVFVSFTPFTVFTASLFSWCSLFSRSLSVSRLSRFSRTPCLVGNLKPVFTHEMGSFHLFPRPNEFPRPFGISTAKWFFHGQMAKWPSITFFEAKWLPRHTHTHHALSRCFQAQDCHVNPWNTRWLQWCLIWELIKVDTIVQLCAWHPFWSTPRPLLNGCWQTIGVNLLPHGEFPHGCPEMLRFSG